MVKLVLMMPPPLQLLPVACLFQLEALLRCCEALLSQSVTLDTCVGLYEAAEVGDQDQELTTADIYKLLGCLLLGLYFQDPQVINMYVCVCLCVCVCVCAELRRDRTQEVL